MGEDAIAIEFTVGEARGAESGAADEAEVGVASGFELSVALVHDPFDVTDGEEAAEAVGVIDDEEFMDADVFRKEAIGASDGMITEFAFVNTVDLIARGHGFGDRDGGVSWADDVTWEKAEERPILIDDGESSEAESALFDEGEDITDQLMGADFDGFFDEAVDVIFDARNLAKLFAFREVTMDEAETTCESHTDGHGGLGDGIHVGGDDGNPEVEAIGESGFERGIAGKKLRIKSGERDIVVGETDIRVSWEEGIGGLIESVIGRRDRRFCYHGGAFREEG